MLFFHSRLTTLRLDHARFHYPHTTFRSDSTYFHSLLSNLIFEGLPFHSLLDALSLEHARFYSPLATLSFNVLSFHSQLFTLGCESLHCDFALYSPLLASRNCNDSAVNREALLNNPIRFLGVTVEKLSSIWLAAVLLDTLECSSLQRNTSMRMQCKAKEKG